MSEPRVVAIGLALLVLALAMSFGPPVWTAVPGGDHRDEVRTIRPEPPEARVGPTVARRPPAVRLMPATGPAIGADPSPVSSGWWNWIAVARCESGLRWFLDGIYDGGLQFAPSTWLAAGGGRFAPFAYLATPAEQIAVADAWARRIGGPWQSAGWPNCGRFA